MRMGRRLSEKVVLKLKNRKTSQLPDREQGQRRRRQDVPAFLQMTCASSGDYDTVDGGGTRFYFRDEKARSQYQ